MRNIEKYKDNIENNINVCGLYQEIYKIKNVEYAHDCCDNCDKCYDDCIRWLVEEYEEPVLDDVERKYLSAVIKPFRKIIVTVSKHRLNNDLEYIAIRVKSLKEDEEENMCFPAFKIGTMYKGMELNKSYTLQELGL